MKVETYTELKPFVMNPFFERQRAKALNSTDFEQIDVPIIEIIKSITHLPYCFTLQSCYGHFVHNLQNNPNNIDPLFRSNDISNVDYRLAYLAFCIQNNENGQVLFHDLNELTSIDPDNIQFGCAEWFWERQVNSYVLQIEPERHKTKDSVVISFKEALHLESIRYEFFERLQKVIRNRI